MSVSKSRYSIPVSRKFVVIATLIPAIVAFVVGRFSRQIYLDLPTKILLTEQAELLSELTGISNLQLEQHQQSADPTLPSPVVPKGKKSPYTVYTSKNYNTAESSSTKSRWVIVQEYGPDDAASEDCENPDTPVESADNETEEVYVPAGQHLLVDLDNLDRDFLDSEERLAGAMVELVNECGLTLLSYHCHGLKPAGVTCVGILLESHISLHTWPGQGVITLDLFTCGSQSLIPTLPSLEKLFSIPASKDQRVSMVWAHKLRGFPDDEQGTNDIFAMADMQYFPVGRMMDFKREVVSTKTPFQSIDVYDVLLSEVTTREGYEKSLLPGTGTYESEHPELFEPDRIVYLDGALQSRLENDAAYHEALVHPALFAHKNPKRVAIIGGGEGATLREVLKHNTIEQVYMIEIDEMMVDVSRKYLPQWSDCSNLAGSTANCFDEPRATMYYEDAIGWFITRYLDKDSTEEKFDIIIMDALDPQNDVEFAAALYDNPDFYNSLYNSLGDDGIFISQVGEATTVSNPSDQLTRNVHVVSMINTAVDIGFQSITTYAEDHCGFLAPWEFLVSFKDYQTRSHWYENEALVNLKIQRRSMQTVDGTHPLRYFDGATMTQYQHPTKGAETVFCRRSPTPIPCEDGHALNPHVEHFSTQDLEVKQSTLGAAAGRGVFAKKDIPQGSYVGMDRLVHSVYMAPATYDIVGEWEIAEHWNWDFWGGSIEAYTHGYGHLFGDHGGDRVYSDASLHTFINHACNAQNNIGHDISVTEKADSKDTPEEVQKYALKEYAYNPFAERQMHFYSSGVARRDIQAGEELFDNYLAMSGGKPGHWAEGVLSLRAQCAGEDIGRITEYQREKDEEDAEKAAANSS